MEFLCPKLWIECCFLKLVLEPNFLEGKKQKDHGLREGSTSFNPRGFALSR